MFADGWLVALCCSPLGAAFSGSVVTRDDWFGAWPPPSPAVDGGEIPADACGPKPPGS